MIHVPWCFLMCSYNIYVHIFRDILLVYDIIWIWSYRTFATPELHVQYYTDYTILAPIGKPSGTFAGRACSPKDLNGSLNALANMEATHVLLRKSSGKIRSQWNCGRRVPLRYCACKRFGCAAAGAKDSCFRIGRHECVARNVTGFTRLNVFPLLKSIESNSMKMDVRATHDQTPTQCAVQTPCCGSKVTL